MIFCEVFIDPDLGPAGVVDAHGVDIGVEESHLPVEQGEDFEDVLQEQEGLLLAEGRQFAYSGQVLREHPLLLRGTQQVPLYLVVEHQRNVFLRPTPLSPQEDLLRTLTGGMICRFVTFVEVEEGASHPVLKDGLHSDPGQSLPVLLVEIAPAVLVTHIIYKALAMGGVWQQRDENHAVQYQMKAWQVSFMRWVQWFSARTASTSTFSPLRNATRRQHLMMNPILRSLTPCRESTSFSPSSFSSSFIRQQISSEKVSTSQRFTCLPLFSMMWLQRFLSASLMDAFQDEIFYSRRMHSSELRKLSRSLSFMLQKLKRKGLEQERSSLVRWSSPRASCTFNRSMQNFLQARKTSSSQHSASSQISLNSFTQAGRRLSSSRCNSTRSTTSRLSLKLRSILLLTIRQRSSSGTREWYCLTLRMIRLLRARAFIRSTLDSLASKEQILPAIFTGFPGVRVFSSFPFQIEHAALFPLLLVFFIDFRRQDIFFRDFCRSSCEKILPDFFYRDVSLFFLGSSSGHCGPSSWGSAGGLELGSVGNMETCLMKYLAQLSALLDLRRFWSSRLPLLLAGTIFSVRRDQISVCSMFRRDLKQFFLENWLYSCRRIC